jgi:hypothetical protein
MSIEVLHTVDAVVDALGGTGAVANLVGKTDAAISNWRKSDQFPAYTYLRIRAELEKASKSAPDSLWAMAAAVAS